MFNKILVPFHVRFIPRMTLRAAAALANAGAEITLLHVTNPCDCAETVFTVIDADQIERYASRIRHKIDNVSSILSEYGVTAETLIVRSSPVHAAINRVARDIGADAILMGTHGRRGLSRVLYGSVTEHVMREADVAVIAIRESSSKLFLPLFQEQRRPV